MEPNTTPNATDEIEVLEVDSIFFPDDPKGESVIFSVYSEESKLKKAVQALSRNEFLGKEITTYTSHSGNWLDNTHEPMLGEGMLAGTIVGVIIGGLVSWMLNLRFAGIHYQTDLRDRLATICICMGIGGFLCGVLGAIIGFAMPEHELGKYESGMDDGYLLLRVQGSHERMLNAKSILENEGAKVTLVETAKTETMDNDRLAS